MASQMSRVEQELNELRQKHLAKNQRDKLKNGKIGCSATSLGIVISFNNLTL